MGIPMKDFLDQIPWSWKTHSKCGQSGLFLPVEVEIKEMEECFLWSFLPSPSLVSSSAAVLL